MPLEERHFSMIETAAPGVKPDRGAFSALFDRIVALNEIINVTAVTDPAGVALKHFADSLSLVKTGLFDSLPPGSACFDIGCGGGFPGLPLAIAFPRLRLTMIDATKKKIDALTETCRTVGANNVVPLCGRAEELAAPASALRESADIAVSRALARLNVLCELCLPFVKPGGYFVAMKGKDAPAELDEARRAIRALGGTLEKVVDVTLTPDAFDHLDLPPEELAAARDYASAQRALIVIRKSSPTPPAYPRPFAKIKKQPL